MARPTTAAVAHLTGVPVAPPEGPRPMIGSRNGRPPSEALQRQTVASGRRVGSSLASRTPSRSCPCSRVTSSSDHGVEASCEAGWRSSRVLISASVDWSSSVSSLSRRWTSCSKEANRESVRSMSCCDALAIAADWVRLAACSRSSRIGSSCIRFSVSHPRSIVVTSSCSRSAVSSRIWRLASRHWPAYASSCPTTRE